MKKMLFLLIAIVGITLQGMAQTPFKVKTPPFKKFVKVIASDVNLRKAPSTNSPRLIYEEDEMGDLYPSWSSGKIRPGQEVAHAKVLPVCESSDFPDVNNVDGWLCGHYEGQFVYIMKKFCEEVSLRPLPKNNGCISTITTGKYKDYCFLMEESYGGFLFRMGQYVNGMYIFNYTTWANAYNDSATTIDKDNGIDLNKKYADEYGQPDLEKILSDSKMVEMLMNSVSEMRYEQVIYFGVVGDDSINEIKDF